MSSNHIDVDSERVHYTLNIHIIVFVIIASYVLELTYLTIFFIYTILNVRLISTITKTNIFFKKLQINLIIYHQTSFFKKIKSSVMSHLDICYKFKFILKRGFFYHKFLEYFMVILLFPRIVGKSCWNMMYASK